MQRLRYHARVQRALRNLIIKTIGLKSLWGKLGDVSLRSFSFSDLHGRRCGSSRCAPRAGRLQSQKGCTSLLRPGLTGRPNRLVLARGEILQVVHLLSRYRPPPRPH